MANGQGLRPHNPPNLVWSGQSSPTLVFAISPQLHIPPPSLNHSLFLVVFGLQVGMDEEEGLLEILPFSPPRSPSNSSATGADSSVSSITTSATSTTTTQPVATDGGGRDPERSPPAKAAKSNEGKRRSIHKVLEVCPPDSMSTIEERIKAFRLTEEGEGRSLVFPFPPTPQLFMDMMS
jgi:hypothetical protein